MISFRDMHSAAISPSALHVPLRIPSGFRPGAAPPVRVALAERTHHGDGSARGAPRSAVPQRAERPRTSMCRKGPLGPVASYIPSPPARPGTSRSTRSTASAKR